MRGPFPFTEILGRVRQGDPAAQCALFQTCWDGTVGAARCCLRRRGLTRPSACDAEDIAQEVLLELFAGLSAGRYWLADRAALGALLQNMADHRVLNAAQRQRAAKRDVRRLCATPADDLPLHAAGNDPAEVVVDDEWRTRMRELIAALDPLDRALARELLAGRPLLQAAAELGITREEARQRLRRLRQKFRDFRFSAS